MVSAGGASFWDSPRPGSVTSAAAAAQTPGSGGAESRTDPITFVVIGSSGHGKSTVLNEIADKGSADKGIFKVDPGGQSCTQAGGEWDERNTKLIEISDGENKHSLKLVDTPGFPDPKPAKAAEYYDHVVGKCNEPINGVVFVMQPHRECQDNLERYAILLKEFVNLSVPLIIVVNGTEKCWGRDESQESFKARRERGLPGFREFARTVERKTELQAREILVSFCLDDLHDLGKNILHCLAESPPQASHLRTFAEIRRDMEEAQDAEEAAKQKAYDAQQRIKRCQEDIDALESQIFKLKCAAAVAGVVSFQIPSLGMLSGIALGKVIMDKQQRVKELYENIGDAEGAKKAAGNLEAMRRVVESWQERVCGLSKHLRYNPSVRV